MLPTPLQLYLSSFKFTFFILLWMQQSRQLWVKGSGSTGCLLTSTLDDRQQFISFNPGFIVKQLAISGGFVLAIDQNGNLYLWGTFKNNIIDRPVLLKNGVTRISCGWQHALFETAENIYGIGSNSNLSLGIQQPKYIEQPTVIWKGKVDHFICGFRQSFIIAENALYGCGQSKKYQLGCSSKSPFPWRKLFIQLYSIIKAPIIKLSVGKRYLLLLTEKGEIWALGFNEQNAFNSMNVSHFIIPSLIYENIRDVSSGWAHIAMITDDCKVVTFGRNNLGQLGRKQEEEMLLPLKEGEKIEKIESGSEYSFVLTSFGALIGWGWNEHWNISNCGTKILSTPQKITVQGFCKRLWTYPAITIIDKIEE